MTKLYKYRRDNGLCVACGEKATQGTRCDIHAEHNRKKTLESNHRKRQKVFAHYCAGEPHCMCPGCRTRYIGFLQLDHVNGWGRDSRRKLQLGNGGARYWKWIIENNYPDGFQILCANCNGMGAKGKKKHCPLAGQEHY
jgi:hypothetical protein